MCLANMSKGILLLCTLLVCQIHFGHTRNSHSSYSNNNVTCIGSERRALLEFKGGLVDEANRLSSWIGEDCCNWVGITCNHRTGHVQKLDLRNPIQPYEDHNSGSNNYDSFFNNCLRGEINPSILNLEHLNYLDLSSNAFTEIVQIPTFIGSLKNLRYLNLTATGIGGEIPPHLGNLSNLQYLYLGESAYPVYAPNLLTAQSLKWITKLTSLKALDLSGTYLGESVDWLYAISMLPSLSSLSLLGCGLVDTDLSLPLSPIVNLTSLVSLDLGGNLLNSTILPPLLNLSSQLAVLKLDRNSMQGPIPIMLDKFTSLTVLDLSGNSFNSSSVLHSFCNQTSLVYLNLRENHFQGSLPLCLGNLTSLTLLDLASNNFGGKIPSEVGHLKQLTSLDLSSNNFECSVPSSFGQLSKLEILNLGYNHLYGIIPSTLGQLTKLQELDISFNSLTGELSESHFEKLKSLKLLSISGNYFLSFIMSSQWSPPFQLQFIRMDSVLLGHQFPPWLQTQRDVEELSMNNASISSVIPAWFSTFCSSINTLNLSNNNIHGSFMSFPPNIQTLDLSNNLLTLSLDTNYATYMFTLLLHNNLLTGNIPNNLCNSSRLFVLSLANNQLTGSIPLCFGSLKHLYALDLSNNNLSGQIPSTLGNSTSLWLLHLSRNKFYGVLPSSMKNLKSLKTLDLGENQLTGTIPEWIGKELSDLKFLRLKSNNFYGNISVHLCQLSLLQILNLAENNLVGHIPHCFGNFSMMMSNDEPPFSGVAGYTEELGTIMKGIELMYSSNLRYLKSILLSGNNLHGEIPNELMILEGLESLNLSDNKLSGRIPEKIGNLKHLESLDLAVNQLSGPIPQSLANIDGLGFLNLSFNNLVGRIPSGNHFDTFNDQSIYEGNSGLCGNPLAKSCSDAAPSKGKGPTLHQNIDEGFEFSWFYSGLTPGFSIGLVGIFCILYFKKSWRQAYFGFVEKIYDTVWINFSVKISQFQRRLN